nr:MAG TPA_asm: hypothetical protein [Caudoviricetes sp.]
MIQYLPPGRRVKRSMRYKKLERNGCLQQTTGL